jgi:hypothetical protein
MSTKGKIILWSIIGAIALSIAGFFGIRNLIRNSKTAPFRERMQTYTTRPDNYEPLQLDPLGLPVSFQKAGPVQKKMIVIDMREKDVDSLYWDLPEELRAATPDEVGTVVWMEWDKIQRMIYGTKPGWQHHVKVTVIDMSRKTVVAHGCFIGSMPPSSISSRSSEGNGSKPTDEVVRFLATLPRS